MPSKDKNNKGIILNVLLALVIVALGALIGSYFADYSFIKTFLIFLAIYVGLSLINDIVRLAIRNSRTGGKKKEKKQTEDKSEEQDKPRKVVYEEVDYSQKAREYTRKINYDVPEESVREQKSSTSDYSYTSVYESNNNGISDANPFSSSDEKKYVSEKEKITPENDKHSETDDEKNSNERIVISEPRFIFTSSKKEEVSEEPQEKQDEIQELTAESEENIKEEYAETAAEIPDEIPSEWAEPREKEEEITNRETKDTDSRSHIESLVKTEYDIPDSFEKIKGIDEIESEARDLSKSINEKLSYTSSSHIVRFKVGKNKTKTEAQQEKERSEARPRLYDSEVEETTNVSLGIVSGQDASEKEDRNQKTEEKAVREENFGTVGEISQETVKDESKESLYSSVDDTKETDGDLTYDKSAVSADRNKLSQLYGAKKERKDYSSEEDSHKKIGFFASLKKNDNKNEEIQEKKNLNEEPKEVLTEVKKEAPVVRKVKYTVPSLDILADHRDSNRNPEREEQIIKTNEEKLLSALSSFGINAKITNAQRGPSVTRYELQPEPGVKVSRILSLSDDIALSLASAGIRFEAPIPGKSAIGIEVPNKETDIVYLKDILKSPDYLNAPSKLSVGLGRDIAGNVVVGDISKFPHVLIAGSTGSGKSVCINTIITSILFKATPDDVKMIMIDPKVVELGIYNGLPHLLIPVVTNPKKAAAALNWAVQEVENRYAAFAAKMVRDLKGYNQTNPPEKMPHIVIIIDELADLMMTSSKEVEDCIIRLAQKARAAGVHLVIATQRPSVDVITGLIKANIPSRIAFAVTSYVDSRTILDAAGAEKLLGRGDMLYNPIGMIKPKRVQGAFVSDDEVETLVNEIKSNYGIIQYNQDVINAIDKPAQEKQGSGSKSEEDENQDLEMILQAGDLAVEFGQMSTSFLQRKLKLGFGRAARVIDALEERGIVSAAEGSKPRTCLITKEEWEKIKETI